MADLEAFTRRAVDAWNRRDVDAILALYADDCAYRDPNTRGAIEGKSALRKYLTRLFDAWRTEWTIKEIHPFADGSGLTFTWRADLASASGGEKKRLHGIDLAVLRDGLIVRTEVYFDRSSLFAG